MRAVSTLEFDRIRDDVAEFAGTEEGAALLRDLRPEVDRDVQQEHAGMVGVFLQMLQDGIVPPALAVPVVQPVLREAQPEGAALDLEELRVIRALLEGEAGLLRFLRAPEDPDPILGAPAETLRLAEGMLPELLRLVTPEGELREDLIPEIRTLRGRITSMNGELQQTAERIVRSRREIFREDRATVRDGRTVLPLVADFRGRFDGIVHQSSGSGETLFVEPPELLELNNRLARTEAEIHRAMMRVLRELTDGVRQALPTLETVHREVVRLDTYLARARYGVATGGVIVPAGERPLLVKARHPLLGASCVPLDVAWEDHIRMLVISGPNTGGKTVLLKTVGLLAMMRQSAVPVPAAPGTTLPHFTYWGVDIGDEQSLDDSLSTFSGHLRNLVEIARNAGPQSLVLLDELGSGTDPEEGTALAMAVVDHLMEAGATILVTTHQSVLKHYGYTRAGAANASMAFDETTGEPTYRVVPGRPGSSHALESARRLGLPEEILNRAREYHSEHQDSVAGIIARLAEREEEVRQQQEAARALLQELQQRESDVEDAARNLQEREKSLRREGLREMNRALGEARREIEAGIRSLREQNLALSREEQQRIRLATAAMETLRNETEAAVEAAGGAPSGPELTAIPPVGTAVRHRQTGRAGEVRQGRGRSVEVQFGSVRMTVPLAELVLDRETPSGPKQSLPSRGSITWTSRSVPLEIDLRGHRLAEALEEVREYLDNALVQGVATIGIIHGTGTGVLQQGVQQYLRERSEVRSVRFALPEDGGFGKTVVELNER